jgi:hypothetical protein
VVGEVESMLRHFSDECCDRNQREAKVFLKEWTILNCMKKIRKTQVDGSLTSI